jgi:hypothetical protein
MPIKPLAADTTLEAEALQFSLFRRLSPWEKLGLVDGISAFADELHQIGLRRREPLASDARLRWQRFSLRFGEETAQRALGPLPP